jgi:isomerase DpgB
MHTDSEFTSLPNNLGLTARIDGMQPLHEMTSAVNNICSEVESLTENSVVVLHLGSVPSEQREWPGDVDIRDVNRWERAVRRVEKLAAVSIVAAEGRCGGPALDLLLAADFRIGTPDLDILLPVNDGYFWPGMSLYRLVRHFGLARARQLVLWETHISLAQAAEMGLIEMVSEDIAEAIRTTVAQADRISDRETAVRRQLLSEAGSAEYEDALGLHLAACDRELRRIGRVQVVADPETTNRHVDS